MVHLGADADPLAQRVVVVAGHMGQQGVAAGQAQGVQKLRTPERLAHDLRLHRRVVVVHDVVGAQQHIAGAARVTAGQGAFVQVGQLAQGGLCHHVVAALLQRGRGEHTVPDEVGHKPRGGAVVQGVGIVPLVQVAFVHHADHVANRKRLELVVRHKQGSGARRLEDAAHLMCQALAQVHVEVGERFVQQHELWARGQRPGQCHALLLAAREFVRIAVLAAFQPYQLQHFVHARGLLGPGQLVDAERHIAAHGEVREQRVVLEHHANAPLLGRHAPLGAADHIFGQADLAARHRLQPGHGAQQGGLAAARGADQHPDVTGFQAERDALHGGLCAACVAHFELGDLKKHACILGGQGRMLKIRICIPGRCGAHAFRQVCAFFLLPSPPPCAVPRLLSFAASR
eukprot:Opistho-2@7097